MVAGSATEALSPHPTAKNALLTNFNPAAGIIIGNGKGTWQVENAKSKMQVENAPP
jgi:hypothetical protein